MNPLWSVLLNLATIALCYLGFAFGLWWAIVLILLYAFLASSYALWTSFLTYQAWRLDRKSRKDEPITPEVLPTPNQVAPTGNVLIGVCYTQPPFGSNN